MSACFVERVEGEGEMIHPKNPMKPKRKPLKLLRPLLNEADTRSIKNLGKPIKRK
jgi:hypothetical protein